jgi:hypothetical protein
MVGQEIDQGVSLLAKGISRIGFREEHVHRIFSLNKARNSF